MECLEVPKAFDFDMDWIESSSIGSSSSKVEDS